MISLPEYLNDIVREYRAIPGKPLVLLKGTSFLPEVCAELERENIKFQMGDEPAYTKYFIDLDVMAKIWKPVRKKLSTSSSYIEKLRSPVDLLEERAKGTLDNKKLDLIVRKGIVEWANFRVKEGLPTESIYLKGSPENVAIIKERIDTYDLGSINITTEPTPKSWTFDVDDHARLYFGKIKE